MNCHLLGVQYHLPDGCRTNEDLVEANPGWDAEKIFQKTGIRARRVAAVAETAGDLGYVAARRLLDELTFDPARIEVLLFCTQSPDFALPATACVLQERLGLPDSCGAFDYNLGCSGFTYGLWLARSLIRSGEAANVLLIVGDTYSKFCNLHDITTATIFGDGAAAALLAASPDGAIATLGPTIVGTDGRGARNLIFRGGGCRLSDGPGARGAGEPDGCDPGGEHLFMNGPEIFSFTLHAVQAGIQRLLDRINLSWDDVDLFLFHQANRFMLERLRAKMRIPEEKLPIDLEEIGNTVSASIPILIRRCLDRGTLRPGQTCVLAGFGVGYSWAMSAVRWGRPEREP
jgi:3-oxoacyl-[acyl-carrier-protein] synthase III